MNNEEKILAILSEMQGDIKQINGHLVQLDTKVGSLETRMDRLETRMDDLENKIDILTEEHQITRGSVNAILEWTEKVSTVDSLPLPKIS